MSNYNVHITHIQPREINTFLCNKNCNGVVAVASLFPIVLALKHKQKCSKKKGHMLKIFSQNKDVTKERGNKCGKVGGLQV